MELIFFLQMIRLMNFFMWKYYIKFEYAFFYVAFRETNRLFSFFEEADVNYYGPIIYYLESGEFGWDSKTLVIVNYFYGY